MSDQGWRIRAGYVVVVAAYVFPRYSTVRRSRVRMRGSERTGREYEHEQGEGDRHGVSRNIGERMRAYVRALEVRSEERR